jgi:hypothetical protein
LLLESQIPQCSDGITAFHGPELEELGNNRRASAVGQKGVIGDY